MSDDLIPHEPGRDTPHRWQGGKETWSETSHRSPPPWQEGDEFCGFLLEKLLGSGSSGYVYRVLDKATRRRCAMKILRLGQPEVLLRNRLGFRRMMSLEHPNLVRVDRIYQLGSYTALAMEEIDGITLRQTLSQLQCLPPEQAFQKLLHLLRDFATGLAAMHTQGFVHRDIKPDNLMVDHKGVGRIIDYGLVDKFDLDRVSFDNRGFFLGTPDYFAPEVIWSQRYLPAGDIFSLGVVMLEMLHGMTHGGGEAVPVLEHPNSYQQHNQRINEALDGLSESVPEIIREACGEMLDRDPAERPTAIRLARIGLPPQASLLWPHEEPLVGRIDEFQQLCDWIDEVFAGQVSRLHVTGPSGIGKTRLLDEAVRYIESKNWGQVFRGQCRVREDQPLQAFEQLCDAIAHRYMKGDREPIELDMVSAAILHEIFPVLRNVVKSSLELVPVGAQTHRLDALEAGVRLTERLRDVGPLFLIIDDSQWADRDSLNTLDRLQTAVGSAGLGIITVSRELLDPQRVAADKQIEIKPLAIEPAINILQRSATRWAVDVDPAVLRELAEAADGSPYRLRELADEFRPGGALSDSEFANQGDSSAEVLDWIDRLWQRRVERLSGEAKLLLPYVVTAGGRVSTEQLAELTGLGDSTEAAISELAQQRLIIDDATGGDCISIYHDRVADELVKTLSDVAKRKAHHHWASLLVRQNHPQTLAARIAGHFFAAGEPGRAVSHAILAAEEAERLVAKTEAAKWHARVIDHVSGNEKVIRIRHAARCYFEADFPVEAAQYYSLLAEHVDQDERIDCLLKAAVLLLRSGHPEQVREQLQQLTRILGLPRPKSPTMSRIAIVVQALRLMLRRRRPAAAVVDAELARASDQPPPATDKHARRNQLRLKLCVSLARPMSLFDNLYAAELNIVAAMLVNRYGSQVDQVHVAVGEAVFGCYDKGERRTTAESSLLSLRGRVSRLNNARATADLWAGIAYSHALAGRWEQVSVPLQTSVEHYQRVSDSQGYEIGNTRWLDLWANWHLGRWQSLTKVSDLMFDDAVRRNDLMQRLVTTGGYGAAAWLVRDRLAEWQRVRAKIEQPSGSTKPVQICHLYDWIADVQRRLYEGDWDGAWDEFVSLQTDLNRQPYRRFQLFRVVQQSLAALISLHQLTHQRSEQWVFRVRAAVFALRNEQISHATVLANFYEGMLCCWLTRADNNPETKQQAFDLLLSARDEARASHLRPLQLAAEDAMGELSGELAYRLRQRMERHRVVRPEKLMRLYTVSDPAP